MYSGNMDNDSSGCHTPTHIPDMVRNCNPVLVGSVALCLEAKLSHFQIGIMAGFGRHVRSVPRQSFRLQRTIILSGPAFFQIEWFR